MSGAPLVARGDGDVGEEDRVRAPGHGLGDPALEVRQRAAEDGDVLDALPVGGVR